MKLTKCNIKKCKQMCCYDVVYLKPDEVATITNLVSSVEFFCGLPSEYLISVYDNNTLHIKTATTEYHYNDQDYPAHFNHTRCVFAQCDGCLLENYAYSIFVHKWTFKPSACWLFPPHVENNKLVPPPVRVEDDQYYTIDYPGFVSHTKCGQHDPNGECWTTVLKDEIDYVNKHILNV